MGPGTSILYLSGELHPLVEVDVLDGSDRHASVSFGEPVDRRHHLQESDKECAKSVQQLKKQSSSLDEADRTNG